MDFGSVTPHPLDEENEYGGIVINPASELGKELRKWEQHPGPYGRNPGNPYTFREFPKMLYKAQRQINGQFACMLPAPHPYGFERPEGFNQALLAVESFNRSCYRIVGDASEEAIAKGQGWALSPTLAMSVYEAEQRAIGDAAAEAAFQVQRMTENARTEFAAANASTHQHVTDLKGAKKGAKAVTAVEED
jgi:hypothetical protein